MMGPTLLTDIAPRTAPEPDIVASFGLVKMRGPAAQAFGTITSSCRGKTKYETYEKAKRGARRLKGLVSYHCRFCHGWHNGNRLDR